MNDKDLYEYERWEQWVAPNQNVGLTKIDFRTAKDFILMHLVSKNQHCALYACTPYEWVLQRIENFGLNIPSHIIGDTFYKLEYVSSQRKLMSVIYSPLLHNDIIELPTNYAPIQIMPFELAHATWNGKKFGCTDPHVTISKEIEVGENIFLLRLYHKLFQRHIFIFVYKDSNIVHHLDMRDPLVQSTIGRLQLINKLST